LAGKKAQNQAVSAAAAAVSLFKQFDPAARLHGSKGSKEAKKHWQHWRPGKHVYGNVLTTAVDLWYR
jgi:hypothetical protein